MQEKVIHPIIISSKRNIGTKEDLNPTGFYKGMNLHFILAPTGVEPPFTYTFKRKKGTVPELPCPGCEYEKRKK